MTSDAVRIDLVKLGGESRVIPCVFKRENVDTRYQRVAGRVAFGAVKLWMKGRLLPEGRFPLLMVTGDAKFFLGRGVGGQSDGCINSQDHEDSAQRPDPKGKMGNFEIQLDPPLQRVPPEIAGTKSPLTLPLSP